MIQCTKCKDFKLVSGFAKDTTKRNGLKSWCKDCVNSKRKEHYYANQEHNIARSKEYKQNNVDKVKASNRNTKLKRAYGITQEQFLEMSIKQEHKCACCGRETKLVVDHCHTTGAVRELLCNNCNTALGLLNEDNTIIQSLSNYIRKYNGNISLRPNREFSRL